MNNFSKKHLVILFIAIGVFSRTVWHFGANIEWVTAATILAAFYIGRRAALVVPIAIMMVSDMIIGNTNIFLFTWSAYLVAGLVVPLIFENKRQGIVRLMGESTGIGIATCIWFYLWTNFGVWFLDSWGMYPKTVSGLFDAYLMGIPFLKAQLMSNILFIPVSFLIAETVINIWHNRIIQSAKDSLVS